MSCLECKSLFLPPGPPSDTQHQMLAEPTSICCFLKLLPVILTMAAPIKENSMFWIWPWNSNRILWTAYRPWGPAGNALKVSQRALFILSYILPALSSVLQIFRLKYRLTDLPPPVLVFSNVSPGHGCHLSSVQNRLATQHQYVKADLKRDGGLTSSPLCVQSQWCVSQRPLNPPEPSARGCTLCEEPPTLQTVAKLSLSPPQRTVKDVKNNASQLTDRVFIKLM